MKINEDMKVHTEWYKQAAEQTMETLNDFINHLIKDYEHDYGTICHALAAGAIATCWAMNRTEQGGITGFQSGAIMWQFIREWTMEKGALRLIRYDDMLYPQYAKKFEKYISKDCAETLINNAKKLLEEHDPDKVSKTMYQHWQSIAEGKIPFGYEIRDEE